MTIETDAVPLVETSELHVRQILQNLVRNACEAIEDKGSSVDGHVTIVCRQEGASVVIAVTDTGAGIPEEIQSRMFDPYYTSRKSQGHSGLGLAIVQGIMKRSNGTLDFETSSGGTTFTCRFPVATNATPAEPGPTSSDPVATQATNPPVGSTGSADKNDKPLVLLADDEKSLLMLMTHLLAKAGCEVVTAFDGVDAMEHFMENPDGFDLVVSDVLMPRRNGAQLIHDILAKRPELPVLLVSGYTDGLLSEPWFDPNVPIMNKPFDLSEFRSQVEKMLYA